MKESNSVNSYQSTVTNMMSSRTHVRDLFNQSSASGGFRNSKFMVHIGKKWQRLGQLWRILGTLLQRSGKVWHG
jgi:hypothetical protein